MNLGDLPIPRDDELTAVIIGPGFGESQVVAFPDGRWVVVDCCRYDGECAPLAVLQHCGVKDVDLLVVTHPDQDHISGLAELLANANVDRVWRFPQLNLVKELLARLLPDDDGRLASIVKATNALDEFAEVNRGADVAYGHRSWPLDDAEYALHVLAPTWHDRLKSQQSLLRVIENNAGEPELRQSVVDYLTGARRQWSENANGISVAVCGQWLDFGFLLSGDLENGSANPNSGWSGVIGSLHQDHFLDRIQALDLVKVAHHGSYGAFWREAWQQHSQSGPVPRAVVTPFNRTGNNPPHTEVLTELGDYVSELVVTSDGGDAQTRTVQAGWRELERVRGDCEVPLVSVAVTRDGDQRVYMSDPTRAYDRPG